MWHPNSVLSHILARGSFCDLVLRLVFFKNSFGTDIDNRIPKEIDYFKYTDPNLNHLQLILQRSNSAAKFRLCEHEQAKEKSDSIGLLFNTVRLIWRDEFKKAINPKTKENAKEIEEVGFTYLIKSQMSGVVLLGTGNTTISIE